VSRENSVVRLNYRGGDSWGRVDSEFEFGFLAIVCRQTFKKKGAESRTGSSAKGVKDEEALEGRAVVLSHISTITLM